MKLAIVIEKFDPAAGGNERSTQQIARRLIDRGHDVTILTSRQSQRPDVLPGGRIIASGHRTKFALGLLRFARWAERQIDTGGYDASVSMTTAVPATVVQPRGGTVRETLARSVERRRSPLKQLTRRLGVLVSPKHQMLLGLERRALHHLRTRKIAAVSRYVADQLFHHYTIPLRRVEIIPNAAAVEQWTPDERLAERAKMRRQMSLGNDAVVFLFAATNPGLKGLGPLLKALAKIAPSQPRAHLVAAGFLSLGPQHAARRLGIADRVRFVGPTRMIDALYAASDVTVLPSWYDPASKVVLESLLHGIPAISTLYNGSSQWIHSPSGASEIPSPFADAPSIGEAAPTEQPAGRVVASPDDVAALAAAMADLCDDAERARCTAAALEADLHEKISMDRHVDRLEALLEELAGAAR